MRGVLTTCYARRRRARPPERLTEALLAAYAGRPFVRVLPASRWSTPSGCAAPTWSSSRRWPIPRTGTAVVVGALDNLVKGAAGQAIQNLNLMLGLDEATALPTLAVYP